jgi:hypothetical protein
MTTLCYCPFKDLGLGGGEGEEAKPRPRLPLQHPPHDLVLHTADIQDHLWCRMDGLKMGSGDWRYTEWNIAMIKQEVKIQIGHPEKQRNNIGDKGDPKFQKE